MRRIIVSNMNAFYLFSLVHVLLYEKCRSDFSSSLVSNPVTDSPLGTTSTSWLSPYPVTSSNLPASPELSERNLITSTNSSSLCNDGCLKTRGFSSSSFSVSSPEPSVMTSLELVATSSSDAAAMTSSEIVAMTLSDTVVVTSSETIVMASTKLVALTSVHVTTPVPADMSSSGLYTMTSLGLDTMTSSGLYTMTSSGLDTMTSSWLDTHVMVLPSPSSYPATTGTYLMSSKINSFATSELILPTIAPSVQSSAPVTPPVQSSATLMSVFSIGTAVMPTSVVVPSPTPDPQEKDVIRKAQCHTWCVSNYISNHTIQGYKYNKYNYFGWFFPDSEVCKTKQYNRVWECRDACVNYGHWMNCSAACYSNCTAACNQDLCLDYYNNVTLQGLNSLSQSQLSDCACHRTRICSAPACSVGCNSTFSGLPSQNQSSKPATWLISSENVGYFYLSLIYYELFQIDDELFQIDDELFQGPTPELMSLVVRVQKVSNESQPYYYWLDYELSLLDLWSYNGFITVSFAVVSYRFGGSLVYSVPVTVEIRADYPSQLSTFNVTSAPDTRVGYFGRTVVEFFWQRPNNSEYIWYYRITGHCSGIPKEWLLFVESDATSYKIMAPDYTCGCIFSATIKISVQPVKPEAKVAKMDYSYDVCDKLANNSGITLQCSSTWDVTSSMFSYNITWILNYPDYVMDALNKSIVGFSSGDGLPGGEGSITYSTLNTTLISTNQSVYSFLGNYAPDDNKKCYNFNVELKFKETLMLHSVPTLVKYCSLSIPLPLDTMPPVNLTNYTASWNITWNQQTLILKLQFHWMPPPCIVMFYEVWVGTQALNPNQNNAGSTPGAVYMFKVPSSDVQKRQTEEIFRTTNITTNITLDLRRDYLNTSHMAVHVQLRTVSNYNKTSNWSSSTNFTVAVHWLPSSSSTPRADNGGNKSSSTNFMLSTAIITSSSLPSSSSTPRADNGGNNFTTIISAVVPSATLLLVAIFIMVSICVMRSKNRVILGDQMNLDITGGRILQELHEKLSFIDDWEVDPKDVVVFLDKKLGEGAFGEVYNGTVSGPYLTKHPVLPLSIKKAVCVPVAIKMLKSTAQGKERQDFMNEIDMMKRITTTGNLHIVSMIGCVTRSEPVCLMCELVAYGSLLSYLRTHRNKKSSNLSQVAININGSITTGETDESASPYHEPQSGLRPLEDNDLVSFAYQIADGMQHLASLNIVHRDLACRNVLIGANKHLKITDFGLSREVEEVYEVKGKNKLPWRWMAIESLERRIFTTYSDVWSFGITLWEISTFGGFPYPSISNDDLLKRLKTGYRMEKPENCSDEVYFIMLECWSEDSHSRPSFSTLKSKFGLMLMLSASERDQPYIGLLVNEYVYVPDGIDRENDDPNKAFQMPMLTTTSTQPVSVSNELSAEPGKVGGDEYVEAAVSAVNSEAVGEYNRRSVSLARMASVKYIDAPLVADTKVLDSETVL